MRPFGVAEYEREIILNALKNNDGNITKTAKMLKVSTRIIRYRIAQYISEGFTVHLCKKSIDERQRLNERKRKA